jgi:hypothetical protein
VLEKRFKESRNFRVEFSASVNWSGKKVEKCLKADVQILLDGNLQKIKLENVQAYDETDKSWHGAVFTEETEKILAYPAGFKVIKNRQIRLTNLNKGKIFKGLLSN